MKAQARIRFGSSQAVPFRQDGLRSSSPSTRRFYTRTTNEFTKITPCHPCRNPKENVENIFTNLMYEYCPATQSKIHYMASFSLALPNGLRRLSRAPVHAYCVEIKIEEPLSLTAWPQRVARRQNSSLRPRARGALPESACPGGHACLHRRNAPHVREFGTPPPAALGVSKRVLVS